MKQNYLNNDDFLSFQSTIRSEFISYQNSVRDHSGKVTKNSELLSYYGKQIGSALDKIEHLEKNLSEVIETQKEEAANNQKKGSQLDL